MTPPILEVDEYVVPSQDTMDAQQQVIPRNKPLTIDVVKALLETHEIRSRVNWDDMEYLPQFQPRFPTPDSFQPQHQPQGIPSAIPYPTVTTPLSKAMIEGCKIRPNQVTKYMLDKRLGSCALGAVYAYADKHHMLSSHPSHHYSDEHKLGELQRMYPALSQKVQSPINGSMDTVTNTIIDLNDNRSWSRPKIAGWLREIGL